MGLHFFVPLLFTVSSIVICVKLRDVFAGLTAIGFCLIFLSSCLLIWGPKNWGIGENGELVPYLGFESFITLLNTTNTLGSIISSVAFSVFALRISRYGNGKS